MKYITIFFFAVFLISCGAPDPSEIAVEINQPYITRVIPGVESVMVYFEAQNNEISFSGYNISFGDNVDYRKYRIVNDLGFFPTRTALRSDSINEYQFKIENNLYYKGSNNINPRLSGEVANGLPIYILVTAYQISYERESPYAYSNFVVMACPRPESSGTKNANDVISIDGIELARFDGTHLVPRSGGGIQVRAGTSIYDVNTAPTNGYFTSPVEVSQGGLYLTSTEGNNKASSQYGKIYIKSISGTSSIDIDFCVQTTKGITSY